MKQKGSWFGSKSERSIRESEETMRLWKIAEEIERTKTNERIRAQQARTLANMNRSPIPPLRTTRPSMQPNLQVQPPTRPSLVPRPPPRSNQVPLPPPRSNQVPRQIYSMGGKKCKKKYNVDRLKKK